MSARHCPDCGTSPMRGDAADPRRMCGWPCGLFGLHLMLRRVQSRARYFERTRPTWRRWRMSERRAV